MGIHCTRAKYNQSRRNLLFLLFLAVKINIINLKSQVVCTCDDICISSDFINPYYHIEVKDKTLTLTILTQGMVIQKLGEIQFVKSSLALL